MVNDPGTQINIAVGFTLNWITLNRVRFIFDTRVTFSSMLDSLAIQRREKDNIFRKLHVSIDCLVRDDTKPQHKQKSLRLGAVNA